MTLELEVTAAKLTGDPARDIKSLSNHVFMLEEKLRYTLRNLDVTNFNDLGLARYENGRLQIYTKEITAQTDKLRVEFGKETDDIHALISATADELLAEIEDVEGNYTTLKATVNGLTTRVGNVEGNYSSLTQTVNGIQSTVKSHTTSINNQAETNTSLKSQIKQTANKISAVVSAVDDSSGNVTAASIVAAINSAGSSVKISADHIVLSGVITAEDLSGSGTTVINGDNILTGTIQGINFVAKGDIVNDSISNSFVVTDKLGYLVGKIGYTWTADNEDFERSPKLYLMTEEYWDGAYTYRPALKLKGAGGVSIEAASGGYNPVYIAAPGAYITLRGAGVIIRDNIATEWKFSGGSLMRNGEIVL